jgi:hypothetical protein
MRAIRLQQSFPRFPLYSVLAAFRASSVLPAVSS